MSKNSHMSSDYQKKTIAGAVEAKKLQGETRTLEINRPALERIVKFTMDNLALVLHEADRIARNRWGDDIQSGDVDEAIARLAGRSKGDYWNIALGCALGGQVFKDSLMPSQNRRPDPIGLF